MENNNQLPKDWKWVKLGEVFTIERGGSPRPIDNYLSKDVNAINWIKIGDTKGITKYIYKTTEKIKPEGVKKSRMVYEGDFILSNSMSFGKPFIMKTSGCIHDGWLVIRKNENIENNFLYYVLSSPSVYQQFINLAKGSTVKNLNIEAVKQVSVALPPFKTQLAIVSKIEELFSEIENGIKSLFTAKEQLKTYRQSVLKWAFEGKLTEGLNCDLCDLPDEHDLSIAAEPENEYKIEGNHNNQKNQKNHSSDKGELPEGWKWVKIEDVASINPKLPKKDEINNDLEIQFLPMKLVEEIINKIHLIETRTFKEVQRGSYTPFVNGDIIFAKVTPCMENGKIAVVENLKNGIGYGSSEFHVLRCSKDASNKYVFYFLVQDRFRNEAQNAMTGAVGLRPVPRQFIEYHLIPLPPFAEQNQIVQAIESRLSVADKMEESITQSLQQAEALKQSILKKAFEGKLLNEKQEFAKIIPIQRKVLASWIIHLNYDHKYFGLTKFQKTLYLCEQYAQVEYETNYEQERAGPYDREFTLAFRKEIIENDIFQEEIKVSLTHFVPGLHAGIYSKDYPKYFRNKGNRIKFVLQLLKDKTLNEAELIATIYAVWNNMIILKKTYDISAIIEAVYDWSPEKIKYSKEDISSTVEWMKEKNFVPIGFGKIIK